MSNTKGTRQVREPVQVYLDPPDVGLLDELVRATGLPKAELLRRGLRRLSADTLGDKAPGWSVERLIGVVDDPDAPTDLAAGHDQYLYGKPKRGRSRVR
ncbi:MAG: ribbon-helix-helix protein, CopG family [Gemmatimonadales bacterium]|nr:ribbon-helix-helix protein, CopG family [Gemmatimonadales bacterium]MDX2056868.1 ribbon-helix-helix protein, CopG family [Gemmatimonadales bacterium]